MIDTESKKMKSIQDECDELKQMNQLYLSQRLELEEENEILLKKFETFNRDILQIRKEM